MTVKLTIAPGATPTHTPTPVVTASPTPTSTPAETATPTPTPLNTPTPASSADTTEKVRAFLKAFDGGPCFLATLRPGAPGSDEIDAIAGDRNDFDRFEAEFKRAMGVDPVIAGLPLASAQCPMVSLLKLTANGNALAAKITLDATNIDAAHPLAGRVSGLGGRRLQLVLVDNDGGAYLLKSTPDANGDGASFNVQLQGDAQSIGKMQTLFAIASESAPSALSPTHTTNASTLARDLGAEWSKVGAAASVAYFLFGH